MLHKVFLFYFILIGTTICAQNIAIKNIPVQSFEYLQDQSPEAYINQMVQSTFHTTIQLKSIAQQTSGVGEHYTYIQVYQNLPVFETFVKLNVSKKGEILSLIVQGFNTDQWASKLTLNYPDTNSFSTQLIQQQYGIWVQNEQPILVIKGVKFRSKPLICEEHIYDAEHVYQIKDGVRYFKDTTIQVKVFNPDPLTTSKRYYGPPFKDANDTNSVAFENELKLVSVKTFYDEANKLFVLQDSFKKMVDFQDPINIVPQQTSPNFFYNRSQKEFESVSAFFHIHEMEQYLLKLGFTNLRKDKLSIDGHGKDDDNSAFLEQFTPRIILYGDGGVDDAEDADVVVHEYLHYVSSQASPASNSGFEREAIDEGLADYFACAYSKAIDEFRWKEMFTWDGHNEFWKGRNLENQRKYPDSIISNDRHNTGLILAALLADLHDDIGRKETDLIQLNSMFSYFPQMSYPDVANLLLQTEKLLYNEKYLCVLLKQFRKRGLASPELSLNCLDPNITFETNITSKEVCKQDSTRIGVKEADLSNKEYSYTWYPTDYLKDFNTSNPLFVSDKEFTYQVTICGKNGKCNVKNVTIGVKNCHSTVEFYNSSKFSQGEDLLIRLPDNDPGLKGYSLQVFNDLGSLVFSKTLNATFFNVFNRSEMPAVNGLFMIRVVKITNNDLVTEKLIKVLNVP